MGVYRFLGVYGCLCEFIGVYGFLGVYGYLWVSWVYICVNGYLWVLYSNIKDIAYSLIQKRRKVKKPQKSLKSHMDYKRSVCTMGERDFTDACVLNSRFRLVLKTNTRQ